MSQRDSGDARIPGRLVVVALAFLYLWGISALFGLGGLARFSLLAVVLLLAMAIGLAVSLRTDKAIAAGSVLPPVRLTTTGFESEWQSGRSIEWDEIVEIKTFKVDMWSRDDVRFSFTLRDGTYLEVSEDQPGFHELIKALEARFTTIAGWEGKVVQPPFAENMTVLYRGV